MEINLQDLGPGEHTLTITFTDMNGNQGSSRLNFTGQTREREYHYGDRFSSRLSLIPLQLLQ